MLLINYTNGGSKAPRCILLPLNVSQGHLILGAEAIRGSISALSLHNEDACPHRLCIGWLSLIDCLFAQKDVIVQELSPIP